MQNAKTKQKNNLKNKHKTSSDYVTLNARDV